MRATIKSIMPVVKFSQITLKVKFPCGNSIGCNSIMVKLVALGINVLNKAENRPRKVLELTSQKISKTIIAIAIL